MATPESAFWRDWSARLKEDGIAHERMENAIGSGTPDLFVALDANHQVWVELKALNGNKCKVRPGQKIWHDKFGKESSTILVVNRDAITKEVRVWRWPYAVEYPNSSNKDQSPHITSEPVWLGPWRLFRKNYLSVLSDLGRTIPYVETNPNDPA